MSDLLKDYRTKYPQYDDLNDDQLVSALQQKYNTENGVDVSLEDFSATIGFTPMKTIIAEQAEPADLKTPANKSFSLVNTAKLTGERAGDVVGNVADFSSTVGTAAQEELGNPTLILGRSRETLEKSGVEPAFYIGDRGFGVASSEETQKIRDVSPNVVKQAANFLEGIDLGGKQGDQRTWQEVKDAPISNVLPFILETGLVSLPDMAAAIAATPAYVASRSQEIGEDRAANDQRDEATLEDVIKASPAAIAVTLLERFGGRGILGLDDAAVTAIKQIPKEAGKAGVKEGATEFVQGIIENAGATVGTEKGFDKDEALDEGLAGLVAGTGFGAGVRGTTAGVDIAAQTAQNTPNAQIKREAKALIGDIDASIPPETGAEAASRVLTPNQTPISEKAPQDKTMGELVTEKRAEIRGVTPEQLIEQERVVETEIAATEAINELETENVTLDRGRLESRSDNDGRSDEIEQVSGESVTLTPDNIASDGLDGTTSEIESVRDDTSERNEALKPEDEIVSDSFDKTVKAESVAEPIADPVDGAYLEPELEPVKASSAVTLSEYSPTLKSQAAAIEKKQTETDAKKSAELPVKEAELVKGKPVYPKPEQDINTKEYIEADKKMSKPLSPGEMVFHSPGHNYVGLFRSTGIPPRQEVVSVNGRKVRVPDAPQRIEPIMSDLVKIMGRRIYFGKIKGKSSEGFYRPDVGEIRTRRKNDVEVLAHEMAHYLDLYSNESLPNFAKQYRDKKYVGQVTALSYTDANQKLQEIEGFAEFVRHWLTNSQEAQLRAPTYYQAFNKLLATDKALNKTMQSLQEKMHKFYFQGADKLGQALIGKERGFLQQFNEWAYRRDSRIRQQMIDRFHAARKIEQELTGKIGDVRDSAWKQFRIAGGGSEGIADYILNYGTVNFDAKGDLKPTGKSLHDVLEPVKVVKVKGKHKGDAPIDLFLRYLTGRRAIELHRQGRENLIPKETAMTWARLGGDYPVFETIAKDYQAFNNRMLDFYEEAGMITSEGRELMQSLNKDYVPFNRIREQLAGSKQAGPAGFKKLRGGTANLNDILVNIQDGIVANVQSALNNRAKQRLYQYIAGHKDGAIFATRLSPDSKLVKVHNEEMATKITDILAKNGIEVEGGLDLTDPGLTSFWQHGVKPRVTESGNIVDTIIIDGKPKYYEVQDPLLQEMLLAMNPESYSGFMNVMFGVKNFFTRAITLGVEFTGANLVRDTTGATFLSKNNFKPFIDSFKGMYSYITKDKAYQDFLRSGAGYSSRIQALTKEGGARRRVKLDEFGVMTAAENILSTIDNIASAFEYGTRIGEFKVAKKNHRSDMDAGYAGREISTDFAVMGANHFLTGYMRTVPFLNAMVQSQDRVFREAFISKKYDGNPTRMAMKAFLGITLPTLALYLVNRDDEDYQNIPDYEKRTNWHIKVGDNRFVKVPRPYDVGFVYATMPELFFKYIEDEKGKELSDGLIWTLTQMYGIDGTPAMMTGWWDLVRNKKWTGAPVVPKSLSNVEATEQYTSNTSETFVRMGEALGISPIKAEHMFNAYTGYLGGYLLAGTDHMMWDEEKFGPKPEKDVAESIFLKRFLTTEQRPNTRAMEKFFDLKEASDKIVATFKQQIDARRAIKGQIKDSAGKFKSDKFYGLSGKEKAVLFALNDSMNQLIKLVYGKNGIKTAELAIKYNKNLTAEEKRYRIDALWKSRNKLFMDYYEKANGALDKAKKSAKTEN